MLNPARKVETPIAARKRPLTNRRINDAVDENNLDIRPPNVSQPPATQAPLSPQSATDTWMALLTLGMRSAAERLISQASVRVVKLTAGRHPDDLSPTELAKILS